ncbi:MAG: sigma factor [Planctomycetota bacterium]
MSTPWGMIVLAKGPTPAGSEARRGIVELYHDVVFDVARAVMRSVDAAKELVQEFALDFLNARVYADLDPSRGTFRGFLIAWVKNHARRAWDVRRRRREAPLAEAESVALAGGKSPEGIVDALITKLRVTQVCERMKKELADEPLTWEAFDAWQFQWDASNKFTQKELAARLNVPLDRLEGMLNRARRLFVFKLIGLLNCEVSDSEQMADEIGVTRHMLETTLARAWKKSGGRRGRKAAE